MAKQDPLTLQGSLFGAPEPATNSASSDLLEPNKGDADLSDAALSEDALARPRHRPKTSGSKTAEGADQNDKVDEQNKGHNSTDEPA